MAVKEPEYVETMVEYGFDPRRRTIYLSGPVGFEMYDRFVPCFNMLCSTPGDVQVYLNSYGGEMDAGLAIHDLIAACPHWVTITGLGNVMSAGSFMFCAGDARVLGKNACLMVHQGTYGYEGVEHRKLKTTHHYFDFLEKRMGDILAARVREKKKNVARFKKMILDETYLTADEALEWGLCTEIL